MRKSKRANRRMENANKNRKWLSIVGFIFSVGLLSVAIVLSVNQEKIDQIASTNEYFLSNTTMTASSEISRSVNEVMASKTSDGESILIEKTKGNEVNETELVEKTEESDNQNVAKYVYMENTAEDNSDIERKSDENLSKEKAEAKQFIMPINGEIYKEYSMDSLVYSDTLQEWVTHRGVDFQVNLSDEVKASASGTVKSIKNDPRYGWSIIIEHKDGFSTIYTCLANVDLVSEGESIEQGQVIAKAGNSGVFEFADGSHLHFEMMKDGKYINPELYIK